MKAIFSKVLRDLRAERRQTGGTQRQHWDINFVRTTPQLSGHIYFHNAAGLIASCHINLGPRSGRETGEVVGGRGEDRTIFPQVIIDIPALVSSEISA